MSAWKRRSTLVLAILISVGVVGAVMALRANDDKSTHHDAVATLSQPDRETATPLGNPKWPALMNRPDVPPRVRTGMLDDLGRSVDISCASCHANFEPNFAVRSGDALTEFHMGLHYDHGRMTCLTCHNPDNYNTLRLADGSEIGFENVQTLCAQCHAPQARDFARGAHGGMTGYWDRTRGPQVRKNCIDCHDPHAPAFPHMIPTFKPHDRFLDPPRDHD